MIHKEGTIQVWRPAGEDPAERALKRLGMKTSLGIPLDTPEERVGCLLLLDLSEAERLLQAEEVLRSIAAVLAIVLRNSLLFQEQEKVIASRTRALTESLERFRTMAEAVPVGIFQADLQGLIVYVNPEIERICGRSAEELLGERWRDALSAEDLPGMKTLLGRVLQSQSARESEARVLKPDCSASWCLVRAQPQAGPGGVGIIGTVVDISERKRIESELRETSSRLQAMFDSENVGITLISPEGRFLLLNHWWSRTTGYSEEELLSMSFPDISAPDEGLQKNLALRARLLAGELDSFRLEKRYLRKDGSSFWGDQEGRIIATVGIIVDITERKLLEEQLLQSQKLEAIGQLAGGVAHDFNNILTAIIGYSDLALSRLPADSPLLQVLQDIRRAGERAADLTQNLLAFSRKQIRSLKPLDLNAQIEESVRMLRLLVGEDIRIETRLEPGLPLILADPSQIQQVLMNLIVNAADALRSISSGQEKRIGIRTGTVNPDESYSRAHLDVSPGAYSLLEVSDNGCGIPREIQDRVFEPFFTTKSLGKGTGLGLSTVYGIVKQNSGHVNLYSELAKGTTFKVYWPVVEKGTGSSEERADHHSGDRAGGELVLVVEDEEMVRDLAVLTLREAGYEVTLAASAEEAIGLLEKLETAPAVLFSDVVLPGQNGFQLAERVLARFPETRILLASSYTEERIQPRNRKESPFTLIEKPFSPAELVRRVARLISG